MKKTDRRLWLVWIALVVGGLLLSQIITLYLTPVIYIYLDRLQKLRLRRKAKDAPAPK